MNSFKLCQKKHRISAVSFGFWNTN